MLKAGIPGGLAVGRRKRGAGFRKGGVSHLMVKYTCHKPWTSCLDSSIPEYHPMRAQEAKCRLRQGARGPVNAQQRRGDRDTSRQLP